MVKGTRRKTKRMKKTKRIKKTSNTKKKRAKVLRRIKSTVDWENNASFSAGDRRVADRPRSPIFVPLADGRTQRCDWHADSNQYICKILNSDETMPENATIVQLARLLNYRNDLRFAGAPARPNRGVGRSAHWLASWTLFGGIVLRMTGKL